MPVSSFSRVITKQSTGIDLDQLSSVAPLLTDVEVNTAIHADGTTKDSEGDWSDLLSVSTPFSHGDYDRLQWVPRTGKKHNETDMTVTFRFAAFDADVIPSDGATEELQIMKGLVGDFASKLVTEFTVDKQSRTMKASSLRLSGGVRKMFIFTLKKMESITHYEFHDECGCMVITRIEEDIEGSAIFVGRILDQSVRQFSNIKCELPLRYFILQNKPDDVLYQVL